MLAAFLYQEMHAKIKTKAVFLPSIKLNSLLTWHYSPVLTFLCFIVGVF